MELPLGGPALRHYTQSRPRPHRQKLNYRPSRPQETIIESENEVLEFMGRVDEGVEEFFTKRVLPTDVLKKEDEESITIQEVAPASSIPCPPPTKTLRRKLGDFFTLKKRRGLKSETSHEGRPKKASIADFIRPLREVARAEKEKDKDRVKEHDKENEKEKGKEHPSAGELAVQETPASGAPPLRGEAVPPRRALREGKSQSLILLSGSAATGTPNARNTAKKQFEGQHSFEQKLHLMLQRIGVSKSPPEEAQNQEGEMKKAESEGTIIDSKPEPAASFSKPRTMSASSDTRHQIRPSVSAHESAGKPALPPKPVIKPGPPPTTSGRNTPENELAHIQEGETSTLTAHSPTAAPHLTATTTTTSTVLTISHSIPESTSFTIPPSSTVTPADTDICTDSDNITAAATTPTRVTELDSKASDGSSPTTDQPTTTVPTTLTSPTTPTDLPATVTVTSTCSNLITQTLPVSSNSTTIAVPSITTPETTSVVSSDSSLITILPNLSTELTLPEFNGDLSCASTPAAAGGDTTTSVVSTAFSPTTSTSDKPPGLVTTTDSITKTSEDSSLVTSTSCETLVPSITKTTSSCNSGDTIKAMVSPDATSSAPNSNAPPPTSFISFSTTTTTSTKTPTPTDCKNSISASNIAKPDTLTPTDISAPSTSSGLTNPTDTTTTTSLKRADNTFTTSSATTPAISSTQSTDPVPAYINNLSNNLTTPTICDLPITDATSFHLTSPAHSTDSPGQNNVVQTSPEEPSSVESMEKAEEELDMVQKSKQTELEEIEEIKGVVDDEKMDGKPVLTSRAETRKEVHKESEKDTDDAMAEPPSGKEGECDPDERVEESQKEEEVKSVSEK